MDGIRTRKRRFGARLAFLVAMLATPAMAGTDTRETGFVAEFADLTTLPSAPDPASDPHLDAVDFDHYEPVIVKTPAKVIGSGGASFYGKKFHGRLTASGKRFDMNALTAAHRTLPFGSKVRVTLPSSGKSVVVTITDRGPFHGNRVIDLSRAAAEKIGLVRKGHGKVELELLEG